MNYFKPVADTRSYSRLAYSLLGLPLGVFYFTLSVTLLSLSLGLAVIWLGLPVFMGLYLLMRVMGSAERGLAHVLVGTSAGTSPEFARGDGFWRTLGAMIMDPGFWSAFAYSIIKLPLGVISFTMAVTVVSLTLGLLGAPILYLTIPRAFDTPVWVFQWLSPWIAAPLSVVLGVLFAPIALRISNGLALGFGGTARGMLSGDDDSEV